MLNRNWRTGFKGYDAGGTLLGLRLKGTRLGMAWRVLMGFEGLRLGFERVRDVAGKD